MPEFSRLESFAKYVAIISALVAASVGIAQFRRGVLQSVRELEWKQADMARTIVNGMIKTRAGMRCRCSTGRRVASTRSRPA